ncbi:uncharacterized protein [Ptychodera flava]|uniref:uncharacterized protein n=1 Tax=Ptychodera flava TaxID=63121 RepID=UPI003969E316
MAGVGIAVRSTSRVAKISTLKTVYPHYVVCNVSRASAPKMGHWHTIKAQRYLPSLTVSRYMCSSTAMQKPKTQTEQNGQNGLTQERKDELKKKFSDTDFHHFRGSHKETKAVEKKMEEASYTLPHPIWSEKERHEVKITHKKPEILLDKMAYYSVQTLRFFFDLFSGYKFGKRNEKMWLRRIIFLETVAGVPGMVAAMVRHLHSLRRMKRDYGWIHTLLEEAENERMHLMTALQIKQPGRLFRWAVIGAQGGFVTFFSLAYLISPRFCHRFVGYLEEEAVITYTKCLQDFDKGYLKVWQTAAAPEVAVKYWKLPPDATMRDVIEVIRADEAHHRSVNHTLGSLKSDDANPFEPGK